MQLARDLDGQTASFPTPFPPKNIPPPLPPALGSHLTLSSFILPVLVSRNLISLWMKRTSRTGLPDGPSWSKIQTQTTKDEFYSLDYKLSQTRDRTILTCRCRDWSMATERGIAIKNRTFTDVKIDLHFWLWSISANSINRKPKSTSFSKRGIKN